MSDATLSRRHLIRRLAVMGCSAAAGLQTIAGTPSYPRNLSRQDIDRWMHELSNWGRWGKDDQAGTVNLITAEKRRRAAALVRDGLSISLSVNADIAAQSPQIDGGPSPTQFVGPPTWQHVMKTYGGTIKGSGYAIDTYSVSFHGNNTTHLDVLSHFVFDGHIYNGFPASTITQWGATKDDVLPFKNGIFTRGVLVDIPYLRGLPYLSDDEAIYPEELDAWEDKAGLKVESGDAVFIRTGRWKRVAEKGPLDLNMKAPGLYASCAKWLHQRDISVLGGDCVQDVRPSRVAGVDQPIHQICLVATGTPLFDNCDLEALSKAAAERRRWTFLVSVAPLAVPGGTGSPFNPIATF